MDESKVERIQLLNGELDFYEGVLSKYRSIGIPMYSFLCSRLLFRYGSKWERRVFGSNCASSTHTTLSLVKEGFRYHHAESDYLMLVRWMTDSPDTIPANASHQVGTCAFVVNENSEVLVLQESTGKFKLKECGSSLQDLLMRQRHKSFFDKSSFMFVCMLQPRPSHLEKDSVETEEARWMPFKEYASQSSVLKNEQFRDVPRICRAKAFNVYTGFTPFATKTESGKTTYLYQNGEKNLDLN